MLPVFVIAKPFRAVAIHLQNANRRGGVNGLRCRFAPRNDDFVMFYPCRQKLRLPHRNFVTPRIFDFLFIFNMIKKYSKSQGANRDAAPSQIEFRMSFLQNLFSQLNRFSICTLIVICLQTSLYLCSTSRNIFSPNIFLVLQNKRKAFIMCRNSLQIWRFYVIQRAESKARRFHCLVRADLRIQPNGK